jgi:hypothetical protein
VTDEADDQPGPSRRQRKIHVDMDAYASVEQRDKSGSFQHDLIDR